MLKLKLDNWVIDRLAEPFPIDELNFRSGGGGTVLAYLDARQIVDRLNSIVGSENWYDNYMNIKVVNTGTQDVTDFTKIKLQAQELGLKDADVFTYSHNAISGVKDKHQARFEYHDITYGGIMCDLTILGVTKTDVGSPSYSEQLKGATSDSLKRAAVKFGIGAYLYDLKGLTTRIEYGKVMEPPQLPEWAYPTERPNPDDTIKEVIGKARAATFDQETSAQLEAAISEVEVMGNYNSLAPLIVKRALYEYIMKLLKGRE